MKNLIRLGGVVSAICCVSLAHGQSISDVAWAKMVKCAAIADDQARHTCTDDVFREAGLITDETKAAAKRKDFGLQKKTEPLAAAAAAVQAPAAKTEKPQPESLEVTLAKVEQGRDGKLVLTTTDGAVWHQVESNGLNPAIPKQGGTMKIEPKSFGGFVCAPSKYVSFRCYRSK